MTYHLDDLDVGFFEGQDGLEVVLIEMINSSDFQTKLDKYFSGSPEEGFSKTLEGFKDEFYFSFQNYDVNLE